MVVDWFALVLMLETAIFGFAMMLYLSKLGKSFKDMAKEMKTSQMHFLAQSIKQNVGGGSQLPLPVAPALNQPIYDPEIIDPVQRVPQPQVQIPLDPCENCGMSVGEHTIQQAVNCGYIKAKNIKIKDLNNPAPYLKKEKEKKK